MNLDQLEKYSKLKAVLAPTFRNELKHVLGNRHSKFLNSFLNSYSLFIAITESEVNYTALNILNDEDKLNHQLQSSIGFIYSDIIELGALSQYKIVRVLIDAFTVLAELNQFTVTQISVSKRTLSDDALHCLQRFNAQAINEVALDYYRGWTCHSKDGKQINLHIAPFRDCYGKEMTKKVHQAISNYTSTQHTSTSKGAAKYLVNLLNLLPKHCTTPEQLEQQLKSHNSVKLMENVMLGYLLTEQTKGHKTKSSITVWRRTIVCFIQVFIDSGLFKAPHTEFIIPKWKEPKNNQHSISVGGDLSEAEVDRWLVNIPLTIKDDQALEVIHQRLNQDLKHIRIKSHAMVECIKQRHQRNLGYIENGTVKPLPIKGQFGPRGFQIGVDHLANTVATFYQHGVKATTNNYLQFLGFRSQTTGQAAMLTEEFNLPTLETLNAFVALLVFEHPLITPSWLDLWELFDKRGNQVGFFQSGKKWVIKSYKRRRGAELAQQEVILNVYSKSLVEALIEHTAFARSTLKQQGDNAYRYMVLACPGPSQNPLRYQLIGPSLNDDRRYHQKLATASFDPTLPFLPLAYNPKRFTQITHIHPTVINRLLTQNDAHELAKITTPRAIRKSRGLQIYLETRSLRAVSEALGHASVHTELLSKYLPTPLMDFFNTRWVRQFQNAIIYEALKDSPYLFDALDFDAEKLAEFLDNHGLGTLPDHLTKAKEQACLATQEESSKSLDELVSPFLHRFFRC